MGRQPDGRTLRGVERAKRPQRSPRDELGGRRARKIKHKKRSAPEEKNNLFFEKHVLMGGGTRSLGGGEQSRRMLRYCGAVRPGVHEKHKYTRAFHGS